MTQHHPQIEEAILASELAGMHNERLLATAIKNGEPLSLPQVMSLYDISTPIYDRRTDEWDYVDSERDQIKADRVARYQGYKREARDTSTEVLRQVYGVDADWLLLDEQEFNEILPDLLAQPGSIQNVELFASHLSAEQQIAYYDALLKLSIPVDLKALFDRCREGMVMYTVDFHDFVSQHAQELIDAKVDANVLIDYLPQPFTFDDIEKLREWGIEDDDIIELFRSEVIEQGFDRLREKGFKVSQLAVRLSVEFRMGRLGMLKTEDGDFAPDEYDFSRADSQTKVRGIIAYKKDGREYRKILDLLIGGVPFYTGIPYFNELVANDIPVSDIFGLYKDNAARKEHLATLVPWFHENGIPADELKKQFASYELLLVYEWFNKAKIELDVNAYAEDLAPEELVEIKRRLQSTESPILMSAEEILNRFESGRDIALALSALLEIGVSPQLLLERIDKSCIDDRVYRYFIVNGVPSSSVWAVTNEGTRQKVASQYTLTLLDDPSTAYLPLEAFEYIDQPTLEKHFRAFLKDERFRDATMARLSPKLKDSVARELVSDGIVSPEILRMLKSNRSNKEYLPYMIAAKFSPTEIHDTLGVAIGEHELAMLIEGGYSLEELLAFVEPSTLKQNFALYEKQLDDKSRLIDVAFQKFSSTDVVETMDDLLRLGVPLPDILSRIDEVDTFRNGAMLLSRGLKPARLLAAIRAVNPSQREEASRITLEHMFAASLKM